MTDAELRADLARPGLDAYTQALLEEVLVLRALARKSVFEMDNIGQYWCTVCHRTVVDCDAEPDSDAPRRIRIEAAYKLNDLRLAVLAKIDAELQAVSVAAEVAWNFYRAYEGPSRGEPNL